MRKSRTLANSPRLSDALEILGRSQLTNKHFLNEKEMKGSGCRAGEGEEKGGRERERQAEELKVIGRRQCGPLELGNSSVPGVEGQRGKEYGK